MKGRIDWKAVTTAMAIIVFLYVLCKTLDNETLTFIYYYILLPIVIIFSIYKLIPRHH